MINSKLLRRLERLEALVTQRLSAPLEIVIDFVEPGGEITESVTFRPEARRWKGPVVSSKSAKFARNRP